MFVAVWLHSHNNVIDQMNIIVRLKRLHALQEEPCSRRTICPVVAHPKLAYSIHIAYLFQTYGMWRLESASATACSWRLFKCRHETFFGDTVVSKSQ